MVMIIITCINIITAATLLAKYKNVRAIVMLKVKRYYGMTLRLWIGVQPTHCLLILPCQNSITVHTAV